MTIAERRVILFLTKTSLKGSQLVSLVVMEGIDQHDAKTAMLSLLHEGVIELSADRWLSLARLEEDQS
jgi:chaperone required for assembly of F1-ATPase